MRFLTIIALLLVFTCLPLKASEIIQINGDKSNEEGYFCFKIKDKIKIDGVLAEWNHLKPIQLQWYWQVKGEGWKGVEDLSALCWLAWDEDRLYFAFDIWDDCTQTLLPHLKPWQSEGVLLSLRFPFKEETTHIRSSSFRCLFLVFNLDQQGGKGMKIVDSGRGFYFKPLENLNLIAKKKDSGEGALFEGSVPWSSLLPQGWALPEKIEANIIINDIDKESAKRKSIHWAVAAEEKPFAQCFMPVRLLSISSGKSVRETSDTATTYHREVPLVLLNVTVTDQANNYILDLKMDDFLVYEKGHQQKVSYFERTVRPITMAILLDTSGSMQNKIETAQEAATEFVKSSLRVQDQALVMEFNTKPSLLRDFTNDIEVISQAIKKTQARGGTALYDALYQALERLRFLKETKAVILLSDGRDESYIGSGPGSKHQLDDVISLANRTDAIIYSIGLGYCDAKSRFILQRLADLSGGRCYFPEEASDLDEVYYRVGEDLRSQYIVGYYPKDLRLDGLWRPIRVKLKQKGFKARSRKGYYASKK